MVRPTPAQRARFRRAVAELEACLEDIRAKGCPEAEYYLAAGSILYLMRGPHHDERRENIVEGVDLSADGGDW